MTAFLEVLTTTSSLAAAVENSTAYYTNSQFVSPFTSADGCNADDALISPTATGAAYTGRSLGYDYSLFSYVGCRCDNGYHHIYTVNDSTGRT